MNSQEFYNAVLERLDSILKLYEDMGKINSELTYDNETLTNEEGETLTIHEFELYLKKQELKTRELQSLTFISEFNRINSTEESEEASVTESAPVI